MYDDEDWTKEGYTFASKYIEFEKRLRKLEPKLSVIDIGLLFSQFYAILDRFEKVYGGKMSITLSNGKNVQKLERGNFYKWVNIDNPDERLTDEESDEADRLLSALK